MRALLLPLLIVTSLVRADESALASLQDQLEGMESLRGNFQQNLLSRDGVSLEQSSGDFRMLQPNFFAWHIRTPDEQILLAVGGDLWHYDVELETATRRDIPRDSPFSPLAILGGDTAQLRRHYEVLALGKGLWQLKPRFESADFSAIVLEFSAGLPGRMEITDLLERTTEISFADVERNPGLSASDFSFEPPPGVDIYDHE